MPTSLVGQRFTQQIATVFHPISTADKTAMAGLRAIVEPHKGSLRGTAAREAAKLMAKLPPGVSPQELVRVARLSAGLDTWKPRSWFAALHLGLAFLRA